MNVICPIFTGGSVNLVQVISGEICLAIFNNTEYTHLIYDQQSHSCVFTEENTKLC